MVGVWFKTSNWRLICQSIFVQTVYEEEIKVVEKTITDDDGKQYKIKVSEEQMFSLRLDTLERCRINI